jgi:uncharacterized cupredoxin-like copper-binding protein
MNRFLTLAIIASISSVAAAQGQVVTITASDYKYDAPDSVSAGLTTFKLVNQGPELHHLQIVRLEDGKTIDDFAASFKSPGPPPSWVTFVGGPNAGIPDGKMVTQITTTVTAGTYVMLCIIPDAKGVIHVMKGMMRPLRVTASSGVTQAGAPAVDATLSLYDYNFDLDKPLKAGRRTILVKNNSPQWHEAFLAKLPPNTPLPAFPEWIAGGMKGRPPVVPAGGIVALSPNKENLLTLDLEPGDYALYCFLPDAKDGKEHVQHGMMKQITVTKN